MTDDQHQQGYAQCGICHRWWRPDPSKCADQCVEDHSDWSCCHVADIERADQQQQGQPVGAMAAGDRELDRAVAEQLFGWIWIEMIHERGTPRCWLMPPSALDQGNLVRPDVKVADAGTPRAVNWHFDLPHFSTDVSAAWTVVERLREIGLQLVIATEGDGWEVEVCTTEALYQQGYHGCYRTSPTAPEAICAAALAAAGHEQAGSEMP